MSSARPALTHPPFRLYLFARFLALCAHQMMAVSLAQYVYEETHNPFYLGLIGLTIFLPKFGLTLPAGHVADRYSRQKVVLISRGMEFLGVLGMFLYALAHLHFLGLLYGLLFLVSVAYSFDGPANQAIVTELVPIEHFGNAVTWNSSVMQIAFVTGPAIAGWLYAYSGSPLLVFGMMTLFRLVSALLVRKIPRYPAPSQDTSSSWKTIAAGLRFVFQTKIILGIISLDLFAVLLGGAVGLLPVYANDILHVGANGLGILRAAPSVGAAVMALLMAHLPSMKQAGKKMFLCVALFGVMTLLFGISKNFYFSIFCLVILGAADMISVVIRGVLVQTKTPPEMRGRVSAVNLIFIGASNELGEFESGLTASWFGTIPAVVLGGLGTLAVVGIWSWKFPEIRKYESLQES